MTYQRHADESTLPLLVLGPAFCVTPCHDSVGALMEKVPSFLPLPVESTALGRGDPDQTKITIIL